MPSRDAIRQAMSTVPATPTVQVLQETVREQQMLIEYQHKCMSRVQLYGVTAMCTAAGSLVYYLRFAERSRSRSRSVQSSTTKKQ
jgi:hypothetical protein